MANAPRRKLFEGLDIRSVWVEEEQQWYYSITDMVRVVAGTYDPDGYLRHCLRSRNKYFTEHWNTLSKPMVVPNKDGDKRRIMMANSYGILRILIEMPAVMALPYKVLLTYYASAYLDTADKIELPPQYPFPDFGTKSDSDKS